MALHMAALELESQWTQNQRNGTFAIYQFSYGINTAKTMLHNNLLELNFLF